MWTPCCIPRFVRPVALLLILAGLGHTAEQLYIVSWNVESGDAESSVVAQRIADMDGVDIWGLSEVQNSKWADQFEIAAEDGEDADFRQVWGTTGGGDRLLILFDAERFELLDWQELDDINIGGRVRAPLVAHLRLRSTGDEFLFMVNHLYRSKPKSRHTQSSRLNAWASEQELPIIAVGDYNYDWRVTGGETDHDEGYDLLTEDGVYTWVRPDTLIRTQYSRSYPASVLDFVFTANATDAIVGTSEILIVLGDFPDDKTTPDHRPVVFSAILLEKEPDTTGDRK